MSQFNELKTAVENAVIWDNGENQITGNIMLSVLLSIINSLGAGFQFIGVATPETNPGTPDQNVFYIAAKAGTYTNFGGIVLAGGEVAVLKWNGEWEKETTGAATASSVSSIVERTLEMLLPVHSDVGGRYIESTAGANFGKWRTGSNVYCRFYIVSGIDTIRIVANDTNRADYALLKSDTIVSGQLADYATGETINTLAAGTEVTINVPADAVYLYVLNYSGANVFLPERAAAVFADVSAYFEYLFNGATKFTPAVPIPNDGYVIGNTGEYIGKWAYIANTKSKFYGIETIDAIKITANSSYETRYALLTSKDVNVGSMVDFSAGTALTILAAGETANIVRPADAKYLYIFQGVNNTTAYEPAVIEFVTDDLYGTINNDFIKPTNDRITALDEKSASNKAALLAETDLVVPNLHVSVDDCISCFHDLVTDNPASIYDNPFFAQMRSLHDTYGVKITICCFLNYTGAGYDSFRLSDMPNTWAAEFVAAKSWLRFAFHGSSATTFNANDITPFYDEFVSAIYGMTGDYDCIDTVICLQSFTGSLANVQRLMEAQHGAAQAFRGGWEEGGLVSYYLDRGASDFLIRHGVEVDNANNVLFFRTYPYLDDHDLADIQAEYNKYPVSRKYVEIGIHLSPRNSSVAPGAYADTQEVCDWFINTKGYDSNFLCDLLR